MSLFFKFGHYDEHLMNSLWTMFKHNKYKFFVTYFHLIVHTKLPNTHIKIDDHQKFEYRTHHTTFSNYIHL